MEGGVNDYQAETLWPIGPKALRWFFVFAEGMNGWFSSNSILDNGGWKLEITERKGWLLGMFVL